MIKNPVLSIVIAAAMAHTAFAQTAPTRRVVLRAGSYNSGIQAHIAEIVQIIEAAKLRTPFDGTLEWQLIERAKAVAPLTIRRNITGADGVQTALTSSGDVLIARLVAAQHKERAVWLWDTPWSTVFVFEISSAQFEAGQLVAYLDELLVWDQHPTKLSALELYYHPLSGLERQVSGRGKYPPQEAGMFNWWLEGLSKEGRAYVAVGTTKAFFGKTYPIEALVSERFPPLRDRLRAVSRTTLFDELGKGYKSPLIRSYPAARDQIVLDELLARGQLSDLELQQVVFGKFERDRKEWQVVNSRLLNFLNAARQRANLSSYADALMRLCLAATENSSLNETTVLGMFGVLARNRVDASPVAFSLVERDQFAKSGLYYLGNHAQGEAAMQRLSSTNVRPQLHRTKEDALQQMRKRLARASQP